MSVMLFVLSGLAAVVGVALVGFGIPISEFSFGNTLIVSGASAIVGSLILFALAVTVGRLQRILDQLSQRMPERAGRLPEALEAQIPTMPQTMRAAPGPGRAAFPAMLGAEPHAQYGQEFHPLDPRRAPPVGPALDDYPAQYSAPSMRNPFDAPAAVTEPEAVPLSPQPYPFPAPPRTAPEPRLAPEQRFATDPRTVFEPRVGADFGEPARSAPPTAPYGANGSGVAVRQAEPEPRPAPPPRRQAAAFDAMWPAETHPAEPPPFKSGESRPAAEAQAPAPGQAAPQPRNVNELRPVAVLKSGMVDGMGYTLYVDGSIEADLPQGTVRFASINDLRNHLEKNS